MKLKNKIKTMKDTIVLNIWALIGWLVVDLALSAAYVIKGYLQHQNSIAATTVILISLNAGLLLSFIAFKKNNETKAVRRLLPICYGLALSAILLNSKTPMTVLYCIPVLLIVVAFNNVKLMAYTAIVLWVECATIFIINTGFLKIWDASGDERSIYYAALTLMCLFSVISVYIGQTLNTIKLQSIEQQKDENENIITSANNAAIKVCDNTQNSSIKLDKVVDVYKGISAAMDETITGMDTVRNIIEQQLTICQDTNCQTSEVAIAVDDITAQIIKSNNQFNEANNAVRSLLDSSKHMINTVGCTSHNIEELSKIVSQVSEVVTLITTISGKTQLLSLNASIEAARAGEAGRGFSVVADQIGKLASQSKSATETIFQMIEDLNKEFTNVQNSVMSLIESGTKQQEEIELVNDSFTKCKKSMDVIESATKKQQEEVLSLTESNAKLAQHIEDLSAIDEEVYAHATNTSSLVESSFTSINQINTVLEETNRCASDLLTTLNSTTTIDKISK